jgi:hypothetical protein
LKCAAIKLTGAGRIAKKLVRRNAMSAVVHFYFDGVRVKAPSPHRYPPPLSGCAIDSIRV